MSSINKIVQGLWIGDRLSLLEQLSIKSFMANGHEYHLYVYDDVKNIPEGTVIKDANEILPESEIYTNKFVTKKLSYCGFSDYFRIKLIYDKGGYWVDSDYICLKYFDFKDDYVFASGHESIVNSIIKCPKGDSFLKEIYDALSSDPKKLTILDHGSRAFVRYVKKYNFEKYVKKHDVFCLIHHSCINRMLLENYVDSSYFDQCYAMHMANQWAVLSKEQLEEQRGLKKKIMSKTLFDKDKIYSENTAYGSWQKRYLL